VLSGMSSARSSREWSWSFRQTPEALWPLISDTARFNEALNTPKYEVEEIPQPDGAVLRIARARFGPVKLEWEEHPFEWVVNRSFAQTRLFRKGPFRTFGPLFEIVPEGAGSRARYALRLEPANLFGRLLLACGFLGRAGARIDQMIRNAADYAAGAVPQIFPYVAPAPPPEARARIEEIVRRLEAGPYGHGLAERLADHLVVAQDLDVVRLRPRVLAQLWGVPDRLVIELCLAAVREGLMGLRWDMLCPRCRGAKLTVTALDRLPTGAHCPSCNINYGRDFARNVELTFQPASWMRAIDVGEYCLSGPGSTPHVKVQQILSAGEEREFAGELPPGLYRLRTLEPGPECDIHFDGGGFPEMIVTKDGSVMAGKTQPSGTLRCVNRSNRRVTFVIESRDWVEDTLTAHEVTLLQGFRDLFTDQVLRPGDQVGVDQVILLFTDLKGSTALYERIGDAAAYQLVREHFGFLADAVRQADGTIVKTIGDAVMAAFADPAKAVSAALAIQERVAEFNAAHCPEAISIKLGMHQGPCIAVTLNDRLDYFGSTVNITARLQGESHGDDIVISERLASDPAVAPLIASRHARLDIARLRGVDVAVPFQRITTAAWSLWRQGREGDASGLKGPPA
jgi:class 3 adenylate cyclase